MNGKLEIVLSFIAGFPPNYGRWLIVLGPKDAQLHPAIVRVAYSSAGLTFDNGEAVEPKRVIAYCPWPMVTDQQARLLIDAVTPQAKEEEP